MNAAAWLMIGGFSLAQAFTPGTPWELGTGNCEQGPGAGGRGPVITRQFAICNYPFRLFLVADSAVESGRKALDHWFRYPWYDSQSDGLRRVDVAPPPADTTTHADVGFLEALLRWAIWIGLGLLLGVIVYLLVRAYLRHRERAAVGGKAPVTDTADADRSESLPFPVRTGRLDLLEEARRQYQQGNYARAIVFLFSYQLVQLDRQQMIRLARGKTNRQYLREIDAQRSLARLFEQTMVAFEDVFFGNRTLERGRFESCWSRLEEFQSLAGGTPLSRVPLRHEWERGRG